MIWVLLLAADTTMEDLAFWARACGIVMIPLVWTVAKLRTEHEKLKVETAHTREDVFEIKQALLNAGAGVLVSRKRKSRRRSDDDS